MHELHCKERAWMQHRSLEGEKALTWTLKTGMIRRKDFVSRQSVRVSALSW